MKKLNKEHILNTLAAALPTLIVLGLLVAPKNIDKMLDEGTVHIYKIEPMIDFKTLMPRPVKTASATAYFIRYDGKVLMVTNAHVCQSYKIMSVGKYSRKGKLLPKARVAILAKHPGSDLCIGKIIDKYDKEWNPKPLNLAKSEPAYKEKLYTFGYPLNLGGVHREGYALNIVAPSFGVSALGLHIPVVFGQSGSPVVNSNGEVVCTIFAMPKLTTTLGFCQENYKLEYLLKELR